MLTNIANQLTVKRKLLLGAVIVSSILLILALRIIITQHKTHASLEIMVEQYLPAVNTAHALKGFIKDTTTALGFYLLDNNPQHRSDFEQGLQNLQTSLQTLKQNPAIQSDKKSTDTVLGIETRINELLDSRDELIQIAENKATNMPARNWARNNSDPLFQQVLEYLGILIFEEQQQHNYANKQRHQLQAHLANLQKTGLTFPAAYAPFSPSAANQHGKKSKSISTPFGYAWRH